MPLAMWFAANSAAWREFTDLHIGEHGPMGGNSALEVGRSRRHPVRLSGNGRRGATLPGTTFQTAKGS